MRCADHALEYRKLADIKPYQKNPRKNDKAVTAVANSIREYGFQSPIIVDRDGVIIAGHTRYKAAKRLRLSTLHPSQLLWYGAAPEWLREVYAGPLIHIPPFSASIEKRIRK